jgi:hypothetical protein
MEPDAVSILILSPSLMNKGTFTLAPVSTVADLVALVAVFPFVLAQHKLLQELLRLAYSESGKSVSVLILPLHSPPSLSKPGESKIFFI